VAAGSTLVSDEDLIAMVMQGIEDLERDIGGATELIPGDMTFVAWCEHLAELGLKVDGKPFRLDNRPALRPIYEAIPSRREDAFQTMLIIMKATQLGLTVWEVLADLYMACKWEPVTIGLFLPDQQTAIKKSEHRFMRMVRTAPELYKLLTERKDKGASRRPVEGNVLTRTIRDSILMFLWTSGKVTTESFPMDIVSLDEVQEMALHEIDKVMERMGDSDIQFALLLSTANMPDLDIDFWYKLGTQEVWHTLCRACGAFSDLSDPAGTFPDKSIAYNDGTDPRYKKAPRSEYIWTCPACRAWIPDPQDGKVIAQNPGAGPKKRSFLLPRIISPKATARDLYERWARAKTGHQKKSYYNRTLARPYIDADQLPVTMAHCMAAVEAGKAAGVAWKKRARGCYMGIDQMGGFNAVIIKERLPDGRQATIHVEAVFDNDPFKRCGDMMGIYGVEVCVVEQLPNVNDARRFANRFPGRVFLAGYADLKDVQMVWGDELARSDRRTTEEDRSRYTVTLNQYKCMQTALYRIRGTMVDGKLVPMCLFPDPDALEQGVIDAGVRKRMPILRDWVFHHFTKTALVIVEDEDERKVKAKVQKVGIDPHFAFANMLCDVAWARSHGASSIFIPQAGPIPMPPNNTALSAAPQPLPVQIEELPKGMVCGRCSAFDDERGWCTARDFVVRAQDVGCAVFSERGDLPNDA
jgi:hypothetical protein